MIVRWASRRHTPSATPANDSAQQAKFIAELMQQNKELNLKLGRMENLLAASMSLQTGHNDVISQRSATSIMPDDPDRNGPAAENLNEGGHTSATREPDMTSNRTNIQENEPNNRNHVHTPRDSQRQPVSDEDEAEKSKNAPPQRENNESGSPPEKSVTVESNKEIAKNPGEANHAKEKINPKPMQTTDSNRNVPVAEARYVNASASAMSHATRRSRQPRSYRSRQPRNVYQHMSRTTRAYQQHVQSQKRRREASGTGSQTCTQVGHPTRGQPRSQAKKPSAGRRKNAT